MEKGDKLYCHTNYIIGDQNKINYYEISFIKNKYYTIFNMHKDSHIWLIDERKEFIFIWNYEVNKYFFTKKELNILRQQKIKKLKNEKI